MSKRTVDDRSMRERLEQVLARSLGGGSLSREINGEVGGEIRGESAEPAPSPRIPPACGGDAALADTLPVDQALPCMGQVVDTHNPHLPGRVLVAFHVAAERKQEQWLLVERHVSLRKGDRVLLTRAAGWPEWLVIGAFGRNPEPSPAAGQTQGAAPAEGAPPAEPQHTDRELRLEPGQSLRVLGQDGQLLVTLRSGPQGPVAELAGPDVELSAQRRLRLSAGTVEVSAGQGGVDLRTDGDAVVRARTIRLN